MKSFDISKQAVWDSYLKVKSNQGAAGVDHQSIAKFEEDLKNNLYKIWNRMSSGSYFPPPVLRVEIPKGDGKMRALGIPTVADRIAQMVVKSQLEPELESVFHSDSYGYRPKRSAKQAVSQARKRCWKHDWVVDMDIKGFFDNIPHDLMMKAVRKHTEDSWVLLYVERWLKAPVQRMDGEIEARTMGTPQGGVISPLLANLFLHYAFDHWMQSHHPSNPFERYADDAVVHCETEAEAVNLKTEIAKRMEQCGLELHPEKTKIVYCQDAKRTGKYELHSFDFLGFCFRPRLSRNKYGQYFVNFSPAIAPKSKKAIFSEIRQWCLHKRSDLSVKELANKLNPVVRGWIEYYGAFFQSELLFLVHHLDKLIYRWVIRKYKKQGSNFKKAENWVKRIKSAKPNYFVHWGLLRA
ncbi:MAG: group II intron reverse transcriptase/maturase [Pseudomonadota bacterium]